ncbi:MAG: DNA polymerase III subunit delta' [Mycobacterium leprae]
MSWAAIVGQNLAVRLMRQAVTTDKVAHAYLFEGPEGVGKRRVALELAKALSCHHPGPEGACDTCSACRRIAADPPVYPDLTILSPDGRFIKTEQVGELQSVMYARPNEGKVRVAIIDGADRMNDVAGNRLLKLLEEPPAYAVLILLTHNLSGVLPTLISRCQVVHFQPLSSEEVARVLVEQSAVQAGEATLLAALSGGSVGRAGRMAADEDLKQRREQSGDLLLKLHTLDDLMLIGQAEALEKEKEHLDDWLDLFGLWLRDALILAQTGRDELLMNRDRYPVLTGLADRYGAARLMAMLGIITQARSNLQKNANTRLALEVMLLRLGEIAQG